MSTPFWSYFVRSLALIASVAIVCVSWPVRAEQAIGEWITDVVTGCRVSNPHPQPNETIRWSGACSDGVAHGQGVVQWFNDGKRTERYDGSLRDGKMEGFGVYLFASGNRYEGEWRDDKRHGNGLFTFANGSVYDGEWRADKPNGIGTYTTRDGETHTGTWTNGCFREGARQIAVGATKEACGFK